METTKKSILFVILAAAIGCGAEVTPDGVMGGGTDGGAGGSSAGGSTGTGGMSGTGGSGGTSGGTGGSSGGTTCTPGTFTSCPCPGAVSGSMRCNDDGRGYGTCSCPSGGGSSSPGSPGTASFGPEWIAKVVGTGRLCLNPRWLSDDPNARIRSYPSPDGSGLPFVMSENGLASGLTGDGYCYEFGGRVSGRRYFSYGRLPPTDDWAQYGAASTIASLADWAKRFVEKRVRSDGNYSYGLSIDWNGSVVSPAGNQ